MARVVRRRSQAMHPIAGATVTPFPEFIEPCLATLRACAPSGVEWVHEIKYDGYRTQAHVRGGKCALYTRRGYNWTQRFATVAEALSPIRFDVILDGEIAVPDERGFSDFHRLQSDLAQGRTDRLAYFVFDLLYCNGQDLRPTPLEKRKQTLAQVLHSLASHRIQVSQHLDANGPEVFRQACAMGIEGIVSKRRDAPYRSGRQVIWVKSKCIQSDTYPVVAFVEKLGAKPRRIASLYVGRREGGRLLYAGKVGTGYTEVIQRDLRERLDPLIRRTSPLDVAVKKPKATWVEPRLEVEVQFVTLTPGKLLRHAVYKGLRDDLTARPKPVHKSRST